MPAIAKTHQHHRRHHSRGHWGRIGFFAFLVVLALAVIVGLLLLLNNPAYEGGR